MGRQKWTGKGCLLRKSWSWPGTFPWYLTLIPSRQPERRTWIDFSISSSYLPEQSLEVSQKCAIPPPNVVWWLSNSVGQVQGSFKCSFNSVLSWHVMCVKKKNKKKNVSQSFEIELPLKCSFSPQLSEIMYLSRLLFILFFPHLPKVTEVNLSYVMVLFFGGGEKWGWNRLIFKNFSNCCHTFSLVCRLFSRVLKET